MKAGFLKNISTAFIKNAPQIYTAVGISSFIGAIVCGIAVTPKAVELIKEKEEQENRKLQAKEKVETVAKLYLPVLGGAIAGTACILFSDKISLGRNAALTAVYSLSNNTYKEYKDKVVELIGEKKEEEVREAIAKDKIEKNPVSKADVIMTGHGDLLCYDALTGRYFKSNMNKIKKTTNEINRRLVSEMSVSLNEFYDELGLESIKIGEDIGWNVDCGYIEPKFYAQLADDDRPCLVMDFYTPPQYEY